MTKDDIIVILNNIIKSNDNIDEVIKYLNTDATCTANILMSICDEEDIGLACEALAILPLISIAVFDRAITVALKSTSEDLRRVACEEAASVDSPNRGHEAEVLTLLENERDGDVRYKAVELLHAIASKKSLPILHKITKYDKSHDYEKRSTAFLANELIEKLDK